MHPLSRLRDKELLCKVVYTGWTDKALLQSTGDYMQGPVINQNGKEYEKGSGQIRSDQSLSRVRLSATP